MNYEDARIIIRNAIGNTVASDKLTRKQFIELEDALSQKAYDIYRAVEREHHRQDVRDYFDEDKQPSEEELDKITDKYEKCLDWDDGWCVALDEAVSGYEDTHIE